MLSRQSYSQNSKTTKKFIQQWRSHVHFPRHQTKMQKHCKGKIYALVEQLQHCTRNPGARTVLWRWAWSWIHKSWIPPWKGHLPNQGYSGSHLTCVHWLHWQGKLSGKGWLAQGGPPDSVWSTATASIHPCSQRTPPEPETWIQTGLFRCNSVPQNPKAEPHSLVKYHTY